MKKKILIALMAVCILVGFASAGYIQIRVAGNSSGTVTANTGDVLSLEISVYGFSAVSADSLAYLTFDITSNAYDGAERGDASNIDVVSSLFGADSFSGILRNRGVTLVATAVGERSESQVLNDPGWAVNETVIYTFDYTVGDEEGYTVIGLANTFFETYGADDISTSVSTLTVNAVPEPLTLALLGLGGLFIRKRR